MVDRELGDSVAPIVGQDGQEAMELAVHPQVPHDVGAVGLEAAVEIVQAEARDTADHGVEDARWDPAGDRIAPLHLPAGHQVEAFVELRQQARDLGRIVLQVRVDGDDDVSAYSKPAASAAAFRSCAAGGRP